MQNLVYKGGETEEIQESMKPDLFDKLMELPLLRIFNPFYKKHKEALLYLFFGGLAFFLNISLFIGIQTLGVNELANNAICWVICVLFQFFTNRTWVFESHVDHFRGFFRQMLDFFVGRVFTLVVEEIILVVFITWLGFNSIAVKLAAQVIVIILNYIISKLWVFRRNKGSGFVIDEKDMREKDMIR